MNGDPDDVIRSLRRYVSEMLGSPPWKVRIQRARVEDDQRPVAVVEESAPLATAHARTSMQQGDMQKLGTYTVMAYPELEADAASSRIEAGRVRTLLDRGFSRGLVTDTTPPLAIGGPFMLPIYDFEGVPVTGAGRQGPIYPYAHAMIDRTFSLRVIQDPVDELRFSVAAAIRASWWVAGRHDPAPIAERMPGSWRSHL